MDSVEHQNNLPPEELGDSTFILKPIELDCFRFTDCTISNDKGFFKQLHRSTLAKGSRLLSRLFEDDQCRNLNFNVSDLMIVSVVELLYTGTASISVGNRAEFIGVLEMFQIDVQSQQQQQQFVATSSSAQTLNSIPKVTGEPKPINGRKTRSMSRNDMEIMPQKKEKLSAVKEDHRETVKLTRQRSKSVTQAKPRNPMESRRKTVSERQVAKPIHRKKDGPACPVCEAVFKTADLVTLHFNRAHHTEKRVRRKTELFVAGSLSNGQMCAVKASKSSNSKRKQTADELAQIQPKAKRTRVDLKAQNKPPLARQSSAVAKAHSGTSLKGSTAQLKPEENTRSVSEGSPSEVTGSRSNLFEVHNYADDIFKYLKQRESLYEINYYLDHQPELKKNMRSVLVDWMAKQQQTQGLYPKTLFLAVKITDAYLGKERIAKDQLQLLGTVALWIACKYEEHQTININELLGIAYNRPTQKEVRKMEKSVWRGIDFNLGFPLSIEFLHRYAQCSNASTPLLTLASYILEFSLMFFSFIRVKSSEMACAALFMARRMNDQEGWSATLEQCSGYKVKDFAQIVKHLDKLLRDEGTTSIKEKFSQVDHFKVAKIPLKDINSLFEDYPEVLV